MHNYIYLATMANAIWLPCEMPTLLPAPIKPDFIKIPQTPSPIEAMDWDETSADVLERIKTYSCDFLYIKDCMTKSTNIQTGEVSELLLLNSLRVLENRLIMNKDRRSRSRTRC